MRACPLIVFAVVSVASLFAPSPLRAQASGPMPPAWTFRTRAIMTGVSDSSEPAGYKVYSGIAAESEFTRVIDRHLEVVWTAGTHSREIELTPSGAGKRNLGSIEVLPVGVGLRYRFGSGRFQPYAGAGVALTVFWEKSGELDSMDLTPEFGPTASVGFDYEISRAVFINADVRVSRLTTELKFGNARVATLALHPSTLGAGMGFRF
jgi:outer membrane protein